MCAIFGANFYINYDNSLKHRGPDSYGEFKDNYINLFHNRLAIIDLDNEASQPFTFKDYVLVYNGEIYNYLELKKELKEYQFKTTSDTEVLLYAYDKWGKKCLNRFNGDFAFCIYNKKQKTLLCARDRVGNKPFYYFFDGKKFVFASEIKALKNFISEFNIQKLGDTILFSINDNDGYTIYKNIYNLQPSYYLEFDLKTNKLKTNKWYKLPKKEFKNFNLALEEFEEIFSNAVKIRLRSDVSIGGMLSGGIDSSLVAVFAKNIKFYTISHSKYPNIDETKYVKLLQKKFNLNIKYLEPTFNDLKKDFNDLIKTQDDIFRSLSIYMQYFLLKNIELKVVLSGQGADELFGGYYHHIARVIAKNDEEFINRVKIYKNQALEELKVGKKFLLPKNLKLQLLIDDNKNNFKQLKELLIDYNPDYNILLRKYHANLDVSLKEEVFSFNLPQLLRYEDRNSMRFSIENRTPFTDYRIIEFALNLPIDYKFKNGMSKYFLREFSRKFLPKEIAFRIDKKGFEAPEIEWLKNMNIKNLFDFRKNIYFKIKEYIL